MASSRTFNGASKPPCEPFGPAGVSRSSPSTRSKTGSQSSTSSRNRATAFVLPTSPPASAGIARACVSLPGVRFMRTRRRSHATRAPAAQSYASRRRSPDRRASGQGGADAPPVRGALAPGAGRATPTARRRGHLGSTHVRRRFGGDLRGLPPRRALPQPGDSGRDARLRDAAPRERARRTAPPERPPRSGERATRFPRAYRGRSEAPRAGARRSRPRRPSGADRSQALTSREALLGSERLDTEEE